MTVQSKNLFFTVDVEPDCPPFLWTWRGITEGLPQLLELLEEEGVPATFFTTGETASRFPDAIKRILSKDHELGCHGYSHQNFRGMSPDSARDEISRTNQILRQYGPVSSFRAPYLSFPEAYMPILVEEGFTVDSSRGAYKLKEPRNEAVSGLHRLEASITSSTLRIPRLVRNLRFRSLTSPVTLFVHPWEFIDLTRSGIRLDCRFRTGRPALDRLRTSLRWFKARGYSFQLVRDAPRLS